MDYYESVVIDYLRADRALFVNTECCIQITPGHSSNKGTFWYCDAVVADLRSKTVLLCEISYSLTLATLIKRLQSWSANWDGMRSALERDSCLPKDWLSRLRPWLFVPERCIPSLLKGLSRIGRESPVSTPRITPLEMVQPWCYCTWDRTGEINCCDVHRRAKPPSIPEAMAG